MPGHGVIPIRTQAGNPYRPCPAASPKNAGTSTPGRQRPGWCRYSGSSGQCYSQTSRHPEHPWFALVSVCGWLLNHPLCLQQSPVRGQPFPVAGALDDDLVAGVGQPVQGAIAQHGVVKDAQPFLHRPVAGDDQAGDPVAVEDELVEVGGLLSRKGGAGPGRPG